MIAQSKKKIHPILGESVLNFGNYSSFIIGFGHKATGLIHDSSMWLVTWLTSGLQGVTYLMNT